MQKRTNEVTFKNGPVTLVGPRLKPGDKATFGVHPMVNGDIGGQFVSVTFADGLTMTERGQQTATPGPAKQ